MWRLISKRRRRNMQNLIKVGLLAAVVVGCGAEHGPSTELSSGDQGRTWELASSDEAGSVQERLYQFVSTAKGRETVKKATDVETYRVADRDGNEITCTKTVTMRVPERIPGRPEGGLMPMP